MYRYDKGKTYAIRLSLRQLRPLLLLLTPIVYFLISPKYKLFLFLLLIMELLVLIIDFSRWKRALLNKTPSITDWINILGTNTYILGLILISGGKNSPLFLFLLAPTILFSREFGVRSGTVNLGILLLTLITFYFYQTNFSWKTSLYDLTIFILALLFLWVNEFNNKISIRYHQKIMRTVTRDDLTGLFNRRFLKMKVLQAIKGHKNFSLIMLDINYFKYYNDHWGHAMGDSLLKKVGEILKQAVSPTDIVVRISGDEFIIYVEKATEKSESQTIQKIQELIEERHFTGEECFPPKKLTLSYGSVNYPDYAVTFEELMEKADQELYHHKKAFKL